MRCCLFCIFLPSSNRFCVVKRLQTSVLPLRNTKVYLFEVLLVALNRVRHTFVSLLHHLRFLREFELRPTPLSAVAFNDNKV